MSIRRAMTTALAGAVAATTLSAAGIAAEDETVVISDRLRPAQLEVDAGTTVTWRNQDDDRHRMRSNDGPAEFDSGNLEPGESYSFTFTVEGSYPYYDHRDRDDTAYFGMVVVGGAALDPDAPLPETGNVSIIDKSFRPGSMAIATGGTIEWSNDDGEAHTVTATDQSFDSGLMDGGASFSRTFDEPGDHPYFCLIHPEMRGTITVTDPAEPVPADDPLRADEPDAAVTETDAAVPEPHAAAAPPDLGAALDLLGTEPTTGARVSTIDRSFLPAAVEVLVGDTVTWSNDDTEGHTVTAVDGSFSSGIMTVGDEFSMTFGTPGTFDYFCAIHPEMTGIVTVGEARR